ncbi:uncharacterized protein LOC133506319 isoform X2 [Syngnathoides biaculeatus]|nr:uncharacterized protein LOC133506319 isoform X2 [Syngnathoides biaculeatus]
MPMFSLAVSIPKTAGPDAYDLTQVPDTGENVKNAILQCEVYAGDNVVAATLLRWPDVLQRCPEARVPWRAVLRACKRKSMTWKEVASRCPDAVKKGTADHAEYRVLKRFDSWAESKDKTGLLVLYVYASPCTNKCTNEENPRNILTLVERIREWSEHAVVFSKVFKPSNPSISYSVPVGDMKVALVNLGKHLGDGGLQSIFRCDRVSEPMECVSCSSGGAVTPRCYSDKQNLPANRRGGGDVCSPGGGGRRDQNRRLASGGGRTKRGLEKRRGRRVFCDVAPPPPPRTENVPGENGGRHDEVSRSQKSKASEAKGQRGWRTRAKGESGQGGGRGQRDGTHHGWGAAPRGRSGPPRSQGGETRGPSSEDLMPPRGRGRSSGWRGQN